MVFNSPLAENSPSARLERILNDSVNTTKEQALKSKRSVGGNTIKGLANSLYRTFVKDDLKSEPKSHGNHNKLEKNEKQEKHDKEDSPNF
jgi:hypothetical protein